MRTQMEMDAYTISKLYADWSTAGGTPTTGFTPSASNVLSQFDADMQAMTEARVPTNGRILYVTPAVDTCIKQAQAISRQFDVQSGSPTINRVVHSLDDVSIEIVPPELLKTAYDFTTGWSVGTSAKQIHMFLVHPGSVITPISYEFAQLDPPSAITEGKYYYFEESFEDVFILNKKYAGLRFVTE